MAKQARKSKGAAGRGRPTAQVNQSIAAAAQDNVVTIVGQGRVLERALEIAVSGFFLADHLTRRFEAEAELPHPVACEEGCDSCCYNQVEVTTPEALLIGHHVARQFSEADKALLLEHAGPDHRTHQWAGPGRDGRPAPGDSLSAVAPRNLLGLSGQAAGMPGHARA